MATVAVTAAALYMQPITTTFYTVRSEKLSLGQQLRLAVVTDLHSCIYGNKQRILLEKILTQQPDAVLLVGDIYDERVPPRGVELLLVGLQGKLPMFYVTGGHEYKTRDIDGVVSLFEQYGVTVLRDQWVETTIRGVPIVIGGTEEPARRSFADVAYQPAQAMEEAFRNLNTEPYSILLAHRPEMIALYQQYPFDLVLSGHAHGGQVRIPVFAPGGVYAPNQGFLPPYAGGKYEHERLTHIVSRGMSRSWILPRLGNPPELVFVDILEDV